MQVSNHILTFHLSPFMAHFWQETQTSFHPLMVFLWIKRSHTKCNWSHKWQIDHCGHTMKQVTDNKGKFWCCWATECLTALLCVHQQGAAQVKLQSCHSWVCVLYDVCEVAGIAKMSVETVVSVTGYSGFFVEMLNNCSVSVLNKQESVINWVTSYKSTPSMMAVPSHIFLLFLSSFFFLPPTEFFLNLCWPGIYQPLHPPYAPTKSIQHCLSSFIHNYSFFFISSISSPLPASLSAVRDSCSEQKSWPCLVLAPSLTSGSHSYPTADSSTETKQHTPTDRTCSQCNVWIPIEYTGLIQRNTPTIKGGFPFGLNALCPSAWVILLGLYINIRVGQSEKHEPTQTCLCFSPAATGDGCGRTEEGGHKPQGRRKTLTNKT